MTKEELIKTGFQKALPIMISYLFIGTAYGILMAQAGYGVLWAVGISLTVYTGAFQFVLIPFLQSGASYLTIALTALFMNSRQTFYALTFLEDFNHMGHKKWYMVGTLTDETYAVNCALKQEEEYTEEDRRRIMFITAVLSHLTWAAAGALGCCFGSMLPFELKGIDFCMTALFVTILIDQWRASKDYFPAICGLSAAVILCMILGPDRFMLPSLAAVSAVLLWRRTVTKEKIC